MQDPEIVQDIKIVKAQDRTYIQGFWGNPREKHLVVEINERQTSNHRDLIEVIAKKISVGGMTKALALQMRADLIKAQTQEKRKTMLSYSQCHVLMNAVVT